MSDSARKPFWAKCKKCNHCWTLFYTPMEMRASAKIMARAVCPMCGASGKSIGIAKQDDGVLLEGRPEPSADGSVEERAAAWRRSSDVGESSKAIWEVMTGVSAPRSVHPHDPDDLGRCLRLLHLIPEWKSRLQLMRGLSKYWDALVDKWDDLTDSMESEVGLRWEKARSAPKTAGLMREILDPIEDDDPRVFRLGPGISMRVGR